MTPLKNSSFDGGKTSMQSSCFHELERQPDGWAFYICLLGIPKLKPKKKTKPKLETLSLNPKPQPPGDSKLSVARVRIWRCSTDA